MANHRAAAALLLIASLFMAVTISRADARSTVRPNKTVGLHHDINAQGYMVDATAPTVLDPECEGEGKHHKGHDRSRESESPKPEP
ncbi:hypothetical protein BDA96_03G343300 [Sorghum bicolor]|uniref:Uncharacterized protein n=2 Tax=Sorghum bicolor TaxID=4558 RepID=A0A921RG14_SORBI|nr:hypothetical protein BDA96_03G343300 [Sorghum bicolor]KXG33523.1 hypothetical protein SORBI_3003G318500 [Sorghum bicolor]